MTSIQEINLNRFNSELSESRYSLIERPTPIEKLNELGELYKHGDIFVKREDQTANIYGGNKVRNLEMIFAEARAHRAEKLITVAPTGSNFVAALAAHAPGAGFDFEVHHFTPYLNHQILCHKEFSINQGGSFYFHNSKHGYYIDAVKAYLVGQGKAMSEKDSFFVSPGGSSVTGALGHFFAFTETLDYIIPDKIILGVGTCGTIAGMVAAIKFLGVKTKVIGVRCVDKSFCNLTKIIWMANKVLERLGIKNMKVSYRDLCLIDPPEEAGQYAHQSLIAKSAQSLMQKLEGIRLDSTYTSKVFLVLQRILENKKFKSEKILYWHTFSPSAM